MSVSEYNQALLYIAKTVYATTSDSDNIAIPNLKSVGPPIVYFGISHDKVYTMINVES